MDFGDAIKAIRRGQRVARDGWNGKGMYLFLGHPSVVPIDPLPIVPAVCMKTAQNTIVVGWLASQTDLLSDDWQVLP